MRKVYAIILLSFCLTIVSCSKDKVPVNEAPSQVNIVFPTDNLLCINNVISFNWTRAEDPENDDIQYNVIIAKNRDLSDVVENRTQSALQFTATLEKGQAYYWSVTPIDENDNRGTATPTAAFFTRGEGVTNYAPFAAEIVSPANNSAVSAGSLSLSWNGNDVDTNDTLTYDVFFGESGNLSLQDDSISATNYSVNVVTGRSYSWRVDVKDQNGAKSIGQVWEFTVN